MKTKEILKEWRAFLKEEKDENKSPKWIEEEGKGGKAIYDGKEVEIIVPDVQGKGVLVRHKGKEIRVNYNELSPTKKS